MEIWILVDIWVKRGPQEKGWETLFQAPRRDLMTTSGPYAHKDRPLWVFGFWLPSDFKEGDAL